MKHALFFTLMLLSIAAQSQTLAMEYALLNQKLKSGDYDVERVRDMNAELKDIEKSGKYPLLDYDTVSHEITYRYIIECPGVPKTIVYKRIKEWCALKYGDFETVLRYEDFETGKIIVKGYVDLPYEYNWVGLFGEIQTNTEKTKCTHALVATVKDYRVKIEIKELYYEFVYGGYFIGSTYYPKVSSQKSISMFLPLVNNKKVRDWKMSLSLLSNTELQFDYCKESIHKYLMDYLVDYKF